MRIKYNITVDIPDIVSVCNTSAYNVYISNTAYKYERLWSILRLMLIVFEDNYINYDILYIIYNYM